VGDFVHSLSLGYFDLLPSSPTDTDALVSLSDTVVHIHSRFSFLCVLLLRQEEGEGASTGTLFLHLS